MFRTLVVLFAFISTSTTAQQAVTIDSAGKQIDLKTGVSGAKISLHVRDLTIPQSLYAITRASGIRFIFRNETIPQNIHVTIDADSISVIDAISKVLQGTSLEARVAGYGQMLIVAPSDAGKSLKSPADTIRRMANANTKTRVLSEVVITGSIVSTERKQVPNPIVVLDRKALEERGIRTIDQLFLGGVAGIIAHDVGSDANALGINIVQIRGASGFTALNAPIKTYVDGIEMVDPTFINHVDARSIDRVEIALGPQASTLYGSAAISGVMQLFTRKNYTGKRSTIANFAMGTMRSRYRDNAAPLHDHSLSISGGNPSLSYNAGIGYSFDGAYAPNSQSRNTSLFAATRGQWSKWQMDGSLRYNRRNFGRSQSQFYTQGIISGRIAYNPYRVVPYDRPGEVEQRLAGISLTWLTKPGLQQSFVIGRDEQLTDFRYDPRNISVSDTVVHFSDGFGARNTFTYNATMEKYLNERLHATATIGTDYWLYNYKSLYTGAIVIDDTTLQDIPADALQYNLGAFTQAKLGFDEKFYLIAGLRAEDNPNFPPGHGVDFSPRVGFSYVNEKSNGAIKLRGSYGRATRPPCPGCRKGSVTPYSIIIGNPNLQPETQIGSDAGVELYYSSLASLQLTYFNQTASGFIYAQRITPDTVDPVIYQNRNSGQVKSTGIESEANLKLHPFTLHATFVITNSIIKSLAADYTGGLRVGDQALFVSRNSGSFGVSYSGPKLNLSLTTTYIGSYRDYDDERWIQEQQDRVGRTQADSSAIIPDDTFLHFVPGQTRLNVGGSYTLKPWLNLYFRGENLTDIYPPNVTRHTFGRRLLAGVRLGV